MKYHVLTLFPEMIEQAMNTSIMGRAMADGLISLQVMNIRIIRSISMEKWMIIRMAGALVW